ncbi:hypothetical protein Enr10x_60480 [Gimesia panareensis]|uniref:HEAT repeat protein n=1 Tax=Gimesia panareensis TaxID=2527978 RepID=A0A517QGC3_9PLAN|nr:hypothetical protein [Gimesia panareensis]QDT30680.1 hypothetical protein Enr10x_60480 [Gimesia panareensis]
MPLRPKLSLSDLDAIALVDAAIRNTGIFKQVGLRLEKMAPDEQAAKNLIAAFHDKRCAPWCTAFLLGCIGHPAGYQTAKDILLSQAGQLSESYAGVAMAQMRGVEAYDDLHQILLSDQNYERSVREGAAYGMAHVAATELPDDFLAAYDLERLSLSIVSWEAAKCEPQDEWLLSVFNGNKPRHNQLFCAIVAYMVSSNSNPCFPGNQIAAAVQTLLKDESLFIPRRRRNQLQTWLEAR